MLKDFLACYFAYEYLFGWRRDLAIASVPAGSSSAPKTLDQIRDKARPTFCFYDVNSAFPIPTLVPSYTLMNTPLPSIYQLQYPVRL